MGLAALSLGVFLLGFLPVLLAGGWLLLARQPDDFFNTSNWSRDLGIYGFVADLGNVLPAIAFAIGLTFGLTSTRPVHAVRWAAAPRGGACARTCADSGGQPPGPSRRQARWRAGNGAPPRTSR